MDINLLDDRQREVVDLLLQFSQPIESKPLLKLFQKPKYPMGMYLWGPVGRGKTMLMQHIFTQLKTPHKKFMHFYEFMLQIHRQLDTLQKANIQGDYLLHIAKELSRDAKALFLDEMQVDNIADAMVLGRLFTAIIEHGSYVFFTSNRVPSDLFKDGLQRERFEPFIQLIQEKLLITKLDNSIDYRSISSTAGYDGYLNSSIDEVEQAITAFKNRWCPNESPLSSNIYVNNDRIIHLKRGYQQLVEFEFNEICAQAFGAEDYLVLAKRYRAFIIRDIPLLNDEEIDKTLRFIKLIDCLYEYRSCCLFIAKVPLEKLYQGKRFETEFARCTSRINELRRQ